MRVSVTGVGLVSGAGALAETWDALATGRSALGPIRGFRAGVLGEGEACEVPPLDERWRSRDRKREKLMSPAARWAVAAARIAAAGRDLGGDRTGVFLGVGLSGGDVADVAGLLEAAIVEDTGSGGAPGAARIDLGRLGRDGLGRVHPLLSFQVLTNMPVCHVAMELGARGEGQARLSTGVETVAALGEAARAVSSGRLDVALAGGADAPVNVVTYAQLVGAGRVGRALPWAGPLGEARDGARLGEGAAVLVLERAPGSTVALVAATTAARLEQAIAAALDEAGLAAEAVAEVYLGCDGTPDDDEEASATARALPRAARVLPKAVVGETLAAGPALAAALAAHGLLAGPRAARAGQGSAVAVTALDEGGAACLLLVRA